MEVLVWPLELELGPAIDRERRLVAHSPEHAAAQTPKLGMCQLLKMEQFSQAATKPASGLSGTKNQQRP